MIDAEIREQTPHPTAAVRVRAPTAQLGDLFDVHLPNIAERLADMGVDPAGPPYARYHDFSPTEVDVEIGVPTSAPLPNVRLLAETVEGEIGNSELPGGPTAVTIHRGPYDGLHAVYERLMAWVREQGREPGAGPWESYVDDPTDMDEADVRTKVCWPLG